MIACPRCGAETTVTETRDTAAGSRRRRRCTDITCNHRVTTLEFVIRAQGGVTPGDHEGAIGDIAVVPLKELKRISQMFDTMIGRLTMKADPTGGQDP